MTAVGVSLNEDQKPIRVPGLVGDTLTTLCEGLAGDPRANGCLIMRAEFLTALREVPADHLTPEMAALVDEVEADDESLMVLVRWDG